MADREEVVHALLSASSGLHGLDRAERSIKSEIAPFETLQHDARADPERRLRAPPAGGGPAYPAVRGIGPGPALHLGLVLRYGRVASARALPGRRPRDPVAARRCRGDASVGIVDRLELLPLLITALCQITLFGELRLAFQLELLGLLCPLSRHLGRLYDALEG